jgi:DNA polymerase-3 subunit delta
MPRLIAIEGHESQRRKLEELLSDLSKKGYVLTGKFEASLSSGGWPGIIAASRSGGLFDEKRITVVEGAEQLGAFPPSLADFLENEADDVVVAVFGGDTKKVFVKEVTPKITFVRADASIPPWGRRDWLLNLAREKSCRLENAAAALLAESLGSQEELRAELEKLALCAPEGEPITVELVKRLSFDEGGNALLRFLDGVCQGRPKDVLNALKYLQADTSPLPLLTALYNRLRPALYIACVSPRAEGKALSVLGAREYALRMARSALEHFGGENIKRFMLSLIRLSYLEKTSAAEGWIGFEVALWRLLSGNAEARKA